ncbi:PREDICTED: FMRFamide receptor-like [Priapulus caudatus]|uniref:FMRFamide receptor-like n=1 Tax=Priapulus caudatus TaxID=37621 RepID=A0ABM1DNY2_PRICU|nr:PREDICTED: FMRFamide receptor-like [Priapulus caudatus]
MAAAPWYAGANSTYGNGSFSDDEREAIIHETRIGFIISGQLLPIIGVMGVVGNCMSLAILCRREMRSSINLYLSALSVYDTLLIITAILCFAFPAMHMYDQLHAQTNVLAGYVAVYPFMIRYMYPIALFAQTGSVWLTVSVSVERYIAVCHPLKARSMCTMSRAKTVISMVSGLSLAYNMPRFWETDTEEWTDPVTNVTVVEHCKSELRKNENYYVIYYVLMYLPIMNVVPFLALAIFNVLILHAVRKARSERIQMSRRQEKDMNTAMMLICIVAIFFVCNTMAVVINILELARLLYVSALMVHFSNLLVTFNSSINFIIYCIFGKKFKLLFLKIFCQRQPEALAFSRAFSMKSMYGTSFYEHSASGSSVYRSSCRSQRTIPGSLESLASGRSPRLSNGLARGYRHANSRTPNQCNNGVAPARGRRNCPKSSDSLYIIVSEVTSLTDPKDSVRL